MTIDTLKKRAEFLRLRGGARWATPSCVVETKPAADPGATARGPRFGFTVTKKLGNAVVRNRIRRRLRAALSAVANERARAGHDYVLVARGAAFDRPFPDLLKDLEVALHRVHHPASEKRRNPARDNVGEH